MGKCFPTADSLVSGFPYIQPGSPATEAVDAAFGRQHYRLETTMQHPSHRPQLRLPSLLGSALMVAIIAYAHWVEGADPEYFYQMVQEDGFLEWTTFWAFLLAAVANLVVALRQRRAGQGVPWFLVGLGIFCFVVAMEEISWAQRIFGYRPPRYFLQHNYQQEFNFHNVIDSDLRQNAFIGLIAAYGLVLPIAMIVPPLARLVRKIGVAPPPLLLAPGFAAALWVYLDYPWRFAGEIVELAVGLGFLFASGLDMRRFENDRNGVLPPVWREAALILLLSGTSLGLGVANAAVSQLQRAASPEALEAARLELAALKNDFDSLADRRRDPAPVRCGIHKRLYTFVEQYQKGFLLRGEFAALTNQRLPEERAAFFIDPWNDPYWIRSRCSKNGRRRSAFVYSFGPNRRRDSSKWEYLGDDVGIYLFRSGIDPVDRGED